MSAVEGTCNHFVTRKKRLCRMSVRAGATYCGEHEPKIESNGQDKKVDSRERIACPLDSKHTCYASKLEKHLKVCNARQKDLPPYIRKGCNISGGSVAGPQADEGARRSLANVSRQALHEVVAVVEKIYDSVVSGNISPCVVRECHPAVAPELERDGRGEDTRRHLLQASALLHLLKEHALLAPATCFLELGAGKGHLSYYLAKAVESLLGCSVVLVDRASHRHKQDNRLRVDSSVPVQRIRADISDLLLGEVGAVHNSTALVAVSKHLCGVATDLALNCVTHEAIMEKSAGVAMATCCHHRCLWGSYVGRPFLEEKGVSQSQFDVMCGLVSWATCGSGLSRERRAQITNSRLAKKPKYDDAPRVSGDDNNSSAIDLNADKRKEDVSTVINNVNVAVNNNVNRLNVEPSVESAESESDSDVSRDEPNVIKDGDGYISASKHLGLNVSQREEIGFKAKAILDWGRLLFLRSKNFDANLCFYVDKSLSPENVCIVAVKKKT